MVSLYTHWDEKSVQILKLTIFRQIGMFVLILQSNQRILTRKISSFLWDIYLILKTLWPYLVLLKLNGSHRPSENTRHKASKRPVLICIREKMHYSSFCLSVMCRFAVKIFNISKNFFRSFVQLCEQSNCGPKPKGSTATFWATWAAFHGPY